MCNHICYRFLSTHLHAYRSVTVAHLQFCEIFAKRDYSDPLSSQDIRFDFSKFSPKCILPSLNLVLCDREMWDLLSGNRAILSVVEFGKRLKQMGDKLSNVSPFVSPTS